MSSLLKEYIEYLKEDADDAVYQLAEYKYLLTLVKNEKWGENQGLPSTWSHFLTKVEELFEIKLDRIKLRPDTTKKMEDMVNNNLDRLDVLVSARNNALIDTLENDSRIDKDALVDMLDAVLESTKL